MTEQTGDQYKLRLPQGMRDQIAELAKANGRSINAEITIALERHLGQSSPAQPYNQRLDTFVAAFIGGLIAAGGTKLTPPDVAEWIDMAKKIISQIDEV